MHQFILSPNDIERFWSLVDRSGGPDACHLWLGRVGNHGYGVFLQLLAHRITYELERGPIPEGMLVCHDCPDGDNPLCCNTTHHFLGTIADNNADTARKGRAAAKLDAAKVREMRHRYAAGVVSARQLAREYGVDRKAIELALRGETWAHVEGGLGKVPPPCFNATGFRGVNKHSSGLFRARIGIAGKVHLLGYFPTAEEAAQAYEEAKEQVMTEHERSTRAVSAVSADGRTQVREVEVIGREGKSFAIEQFDGRFWSPVWMHPDAPGLDAATVLAMWEQEMEENR